MRENDYDNRKSVAVCGRTTVIYKIKILFFVKLRTCCQVQYICKWIQTMIITHSLKRLTNLEA